MTRPLAGAIVCHDTGNGDTETGIIGDGRIEEGGRAFLSPLRGAAALSPFSFLAARRGHHASAFTMAETLRRHER